MRVRAFLLAAALVLVPLGVRAADLLVWWDAGFNPEEDEAAKEIVGAFERKTGMTVELVFAPREVMAAKTLAALEAGHPPDFLFAYVLDDCLAQWAFESRLADLTDVLGPLTAQFDADALGSVTLLDATTGRRGLHALPIGRITNHVHVWKTLP